MPKKQNNIDLSGKSLFMDTAYIQALLNPRDQYHTKVLELSQIVESASLIWTTDFILIEVGDGLSAIAKPDAIEYIDSLYTSDKFFVVEATRTLYRRGLNYYRSRQDKEWGLTDCISFIVMQDYHITDALTSDRHFVQAGFRALMRDD